jgi:hypothetical protein
MERLSETTLNDRLGHPALQRILDAVRQLIPAAREHPLNEEEMDKLWLEVTHAVGRLALALPRGDVITSIERAALTLERYRNERFSPERYRPTNDETLHALLYDLQQWCRFNDVDFAEAALGKPEEV